MTSEVLRHFPSFARQASATRPWRDATLLFAALFLLTLGGLFLDDRLLNGISVWVKPLKFQASLVLHFVTLILLARLLPASRREGAGLRRLVAVSTAAGLFEIGYIMLQAARGRASHFNDQTAVEAFLYILMGIGAVILVVAPLVMGVWLWRARGRRLWPDPLRLGAALGLVLSAVLTLLVAGYLSSSGSHWVGGVASDAGGLPIVGWSQHGGDLRVAHFFASHGMQLLPLLGYLLRGQGTRGSIGITVTTVAWVLFTAVVFLQALQGQPFLVLN
jgi:hypothetical protein